MGHLCLHPNMLIRYVDFSDGKCKPAAFTDSPFEKIKSHRSEKSFCITNCYLRFVKLYL